MRPRLGTRVTRRACRSATTCPTSGRRGADRSGAHQPDRERRALLPGGERRFRCRRRCSATGPGPCESTTGPGIPPEERERVFEAFYRGARMPETPGSGLGLAIAKAIVTAHGGRIWVEGRRPGGGAASWCSRSAESVGGGCDGREPGAGRRRRTADPARAADEPGGARLRGRHGRAPGRKASSARPSTLPTCSCSTSGCPTSTAPR